MGIRRRVPATEPWWLDANASISGDATYRGTGGVGPANADHGFLPALQDTMTGHLILSRFLDWGLAPVQILCGFPDGAILERDSTERAKTALPTPTSA